MGEETWLDEALVREAFLINPRHEPYVNGETNHLGDLQLSWFKRLTIAALVIATGFLMWSQFFAEDDGVEVFTVEAEVTDRAQTGDEFNPRYRISYTYVDHEGTLQTVEDRIVPLETFNRTTVGRAIDVSYESGRQHRAVPTESDEAERNLTLTFVLLLMLIGSIIWVVALWLQRPAARNHRLVREGTWIRGSVINAYPSSKNGRHTITLAYAFETPDGERREDKVVRNRPDLKNRPLPLMNAPVLVRYVNDSLYRVM